MAVSLSATMPHGAPITMIDDGMRTAPPQPQLALPAPVPNFAMAAVPPPVPGQVPLLPRPPPPPMGGASSKAAAPRPGGSARYEPYPTGGFQGQGAGIATFGLNDEEI